MDGTAALVVGDLNTTDFSPCFRDFLKASGLQDSRQGRGIQASWGPFPLLEIAIDHCLTAPEIAVMQRRVGPHLGSDHRPVIIDLRLPAAGDGSRWRHGRGAKETELSLNDWPTNEKPR
jgi:endonuclease/exonuclease/phosphatase (EEP) superfamily protein YafD